MTWPYDGDWDGKSTNCLAAIEASIMIAINERLNCLGVDKKEWYYNNEGDKKTDVTSSDLVGLSIWGNYSQRNITQMVHAFRKTSGAGYLLKGGHGSIRDYDFHRYHAMVSSDSDEVVTLGWLISQIGLGDFPYDSYSSPYLENILNTNFWLRMQKAFDYLLHYQIKLCPQATIETESGFSGMWLGSSLYDWAGAISLAWTNRWAIPSSSSSSTDSVGVHFETFFGYYDGQDLAGAQLSIHKIDVPFIFSTSKLTGVLGKTLIQWGYWILGAGDSVTGAIQARIGDIVSGNYETVNSPSLPAPAAAASGGARGNEWLDGNFGVTLGSDSEIFLDLEEPGNCPLSLDDDDKDDTIARSYLFFHSAINPYGYLGHIKLWIDVSGELTDQVV